MHVLISFLLLPSHPCSSVKFTFQPSLFLSLSLSHTHTHTNAQTHTPPSEFSILIPVPDLPCSLLFYSDFPTDGLLRFTFGSDHSDYE